MGRTPKLTILSTKKRGKAEKAARIRGEEKLKLDRDMLKAPLWLSERAAAEFERVVDECDKIDILDNLDLGILSIYANAWDNYIKCVGYVDEYGQTGQRENKYGTFEVPSPYLDAENKYIKQIMACSVKLGLATTDRLRLIVPIPKDNAPENKYQKYLTQG